MGKKAQLEASCDLRAAVRVRLARSTRPHVKAEARVITA